MSETPRFYGIYRGKVHSTADPAKKGRLQVKVPQVNGDGVLDWALPCFPFLTQQPRIIGGSGTGGFSLAGTTSTASSHSHDVPTTESAGSHSHTVQDDLVTRTTSTQPEHAHGAGDTSDAGGHSHSVTIGGAGGVAGRPLRTEKITLRLPKRGDPVWVMFEAGNPGAPVWLGTWIGM